MLTGWIEVGFASLLTLLALGGWVANILGLPGNWLIVALAAACWWLRPEDTATHLSWPPLLSIFLVAAFGELLEFLASSLGVNRAGGSRRGSLLALAGSIAGAVVGLFAGTLIPIPIVGNLLASLMLGAAGAFFGAIVGERWHGKDWDASFAVGGAAFWGRLLGTVGKAVCGTMVLGVFLTAIWT
ncbi:MAG: DUF456 domain-containing protein [bacterium]|nr:DUF456 domain-containing protein [bacterium]